MESKSIASTNTKNITKTWVPENLKPQIEQILAKHSEEEEIKEPSAADLASIEENKKIKPETQPERFAESEAKDQNK